MYKFSPLISRFFTKPRNL